MANVFLSFVDEDRGVAMHIARALSDSGIDVARHTARFVPADGSAAPFAHAFASVRCAIVLWSLHSVRNEEVLADADEARGRGVLVSVVLGKPPLPLGFRDVWYADLTQWNGDPADERFLVLKRLVEARLGPSTPHVPAPATSTSGVSEPPSTYSSATPPARPSEIADTVQNMSIRLRNGDIIEVDADAIAVQYPQRLHGLVDRVVKLCSAAKRPVLLPQPGAVRLLEGLPGARAKRVAIIGVPPVHEYDYRDLRRFAERAVTWLASIPEIQRVALPVYGPPGYRLDEAKAFEAELSGVRDALRNAKSHLTAVTLIDRDIARAERLTSVLASFVLDTADGGEAGGDPRQPDEVRAPSTVPRRAVESPALFLCYRRHDTEDAAGRLYDRLAATFGADRVFMDIDSVPLGVDFVEHVAEQITKCTAVIVIIGKRWLTIKDRKRRRRLDNDDDLVRAEIRAALQQRIPVIPVVVQNASMPQADDLPDDIRPFARRNGIYLRSEQWREGVERLLRELNALIVGGPDHPRSH